MYVQLNPKRAKPVDEHQPVLISSTILRRADVATTTVFTGSTIVAAPNGSPQIPIPAIAGGTCAGMILAIVAVVGWKWWGRSIKRQAKKERQKKGTLRATMAYRRAVTSEKSGSRTPSRNPSISSHASRDKKVKFAPAFGSSRSFDASGEKENTLAASSSPPLQPKVPSAPKLLKGNEASRTALRPPGHVRTGSDGSRTYAPVRPRPQGRTRLHRQPAAIPPVPSIPPRFQASLVASPRTQEAIRTPRSVSSRPVAGSLEPTLVHQPSTVSSTSVYSTQSGEDRQLRGMSLSSIYAAAQRFSALTRSSGSGNSRYSNASDPAGRWSWLFKTPGPTLGQRGTDPTEASRLSAGSSSIYAPIGIAPGIPVAYAYGGEEDLRMIVGPEQGGELEAGPQLEYIREYFDYCDNEPASTSP